VPRPGRQAAGRNGRRPAPAPKVTGWPSGSGPAETSNTSPAGTRPAPPISSRPTPTPTATYPHPPRRRPPRTHHPPRPAGIRADRRTFHGHFPVESDALPPPNGPTHRTGPTTTGVSAASCRRLSPAYPSHRAGRRTVAVARPPVARASRVRTRAPLVSGRPRPQGDHRTRHRTRSPTSGSVAAMAITAGSLGPSSGCRSADHPLHATTGGATRYAGAGRAWSVASLTANAPSTVPMK
jgi:hypothetical protein